MYIGINREDIDVNKAEAEAMIEALTELYESGDERFLPAMKMAIKAILMDAERDKLTSDRKTEAIASIFESLRAISGVGLAGIANLTGGKLDLHDVDPALFEIVRAELRSQPNMNPVDRALLSIRNIKVYHTLGVMDFEIDTGYGAYIKLRNRGDELYRVNGDKEVPIGKYTQGRRVLRLPNIKRNISVLKLLCVADEIHTGILRSSYEKICGNHRDNSGADLSMEECLDRFNRELCSIGDNNKHGSLWNKVLDKLNIRLRFSANNRELMEALEEASNKATTAGELVVFLQAAGYIVTKTGDGYYDIR